MKGPGLRPGPPSAFGGRSEPPTPAASRPREQCHGTTGGLEAESLAELTTPGKIAPKLLTQIVLGNYAAANERLDQRIDTTREGTPDIGGRPRWTVRTVRQVFLPRPRFRIGAGAWW